MILYEIRAQKTLKKTPGYNRIIYSIANEISNVTFSVMLPMLRDSASFFTIPDTQEGFPTSGNDDTKGLCQLT